MLKTTFLSLSIIAILNTGCGSAIDEYVNDIKEEKAANKGLIAYYKFDNNVKNSQSAKYNGTQYGDINFVEGVKGNAADFDGIDDWIEIADNTTLFEKDYTISVLLKASNFGTLSQTSASCYSAILSDRSRFVTNGNKLNSGVLFATKEGANCDSNASFQNSFIDSNLSNAHVVSYTPVNSPTDWFMLTTVKRDNTLILYINGQKVSEETVAQTDIKYNDQFPITSIGASIIEFSKENPFFLYKGYMDELKIYNRSLSDDEVETNYDNIKNLMPQESEEEPEFSSETVIHNNITYTTIQSPYTSKVWLDRNLGAQQVCSTLDDTACYGDYYQWGRSSDGHQSATSFTTSIQANDITEVGHSKFITATVTNAFDWAHNIDTNGSLRQNYWSLSDATSVCPIGFRVPTIEEIKNETINNTDTMHNNNDAFINFLKLPSTGGRSNSGIAVSNEGLAGSIWSTDTNGTNSSYLYFDENSVQILSTARAVGRPIRCIKD